MIPFPFQAGGFGRVNQSAGDGSDPYFASVISLLHFDGSDGSTTITDVIGTKSWTASGVAQLDTSQSVFGGSSLQVVGGNGKILSGSDAGDQLGTGDFTIEFWYLAGTLSGTDIIFDTRASAAAVAPAIYTTGSSLRFFTNNADRITAGTLSTGVWYHIALSRVSGTTRFFVNGVQGGISYTDSNNYVNQIMAYGDASYTTGNPINGHVDEARITKGVGRYTGNFTPPASPFPDF